MPSFAGVALTPLLSAVACEERDGHQACDPSAAQRAKLGQIDKERARDGRSDRGCGAKDLSDRGALRVVLEQRIDLTVESCDTALEDPWIRLAISRRSARPATGAHSTTWAT